jgi:hypothetical protein
MKPSALIASRVDALKSEAARFEQLAKDFSLRALLHPEDEAAKRIAHQHLIRVETFNTAARIVAQPKA